MRRRGEIPPFPIQTSNRDFQIEHWIQNGELSPHSERKWEEALAALDACQESSLDLETLYALYRARIDDYRVEPPGPSWDGVYVAESK